MYYCTDGSRKRKWSGEVFESIEWEGINGMLKSSDPIRRVKIVKLMHNWQNTGQQKGRIRDARIKIDTETPEKPTAEEENCHLCPDGCGEVERELHYLHCGTERAKSARKGLIKKTLQSLRKLRTSEKIVSLIGYILRSISGRDKIELDLVELKLEKE